MNLRSTGNIDWVLLGALGLVIAIATGMGPVATGVWLAVASIAALPCLVIDYRSLAARSVILYSVLVAILALGLLLSSPPGHGHVFSTADRLLLSFLLGLDALAPIIVAITLASIHGRAAAGGRRLRSWIPGGALVALPCVLSALTQMSVGSSAIMVSSAVGNSLSVGLVIMVFAGLRGRMLPASVLLLAAGVLLPVFAVLYGGYELERYQVNRLPRVAMDFAGTSSIVVLSTVLIGVRLVSLTAGIEDRTGRHIAIGLVANFAFDVARSAWYAWQVAAVSPGGLVLAGLTPLIIFVGPGLVRTLMGFGLILNVRMRDSGSRAATGPGSSDGCESHRQSGRGSADGRSGSGGRENTVEA